MNLMSILRTLFALLNSVGRETKELWVAARDIKDECKKKTPIMEKMKNPVGDQIKVSIC